MVGEGRDFSANEFEKRALIGFAPVYADGSFKIEDVPPGSYELKIWHEKLTRTEMDITVEAGKPTTADASLKVKKKRGRRKKG